MYELLGIINMKQEFMTIMHLTRFYEEFKGIKFKIIFLYYRRINSYYTMHTLGKRNNTKSVAYF